jgi:hypothetical protein
MNTIEIARRVFLLAAPLTWFFGTWRRSRVSSAAFASSAHLRLSPDNEWQLVTQQSDEPAHARYFSQPLDEWLSDVRLELPSIARVLAGFERNGVEHENPATWYLLHYTDVIFWRPGVSVIYAFGRRSEAQASFDNTSTWLDENHISTITAAWSDDRRAWTRFVLSDREALTPLVNKTIAPLSSRFGSKTLGEC